MVVLAQPLPGRLRTPLAGLAKGDLLDRRGFFGFRLLHVSSQLLDERILRALFPAGIMLDPQVRDFLPRLVQFLDGGFRLAAEGQTRGPDRILLHMKQVGRVMGPQVALRVSDEGFGLVAGDLEHRDR